MLEFMADSDSMFAYTEFFFTIRFLSCLASLFGKSAVASVDIGHTWQSTYNKDALPGHLINHTMGREQDWRGIRTSYKSKLQSSGNCILFTSFN